MKNDSLLDGKSILIVDDEPDVFEAKEKGRHSWSRWLDRFNSYYEKVFGEDWQDHDKEFRKKFNKYRGRSGGPWRDIWSIRRVY
jgi:hypothetical protein